MDDRQGANLTPAELYEMILYLQDQIDHLRRQIYPEGLM